MLNKHDNTSPPIPREALAMTFEWEWVDPQTAKEWLGLNKSNRTIKKKRLDSYERDAESGKWRITHQGIAFDTDGFLIDGQHRLKVIEETGVTLLLLVVRNVPKSPHIDGICPRSTRDHLKMSTGSSPPQKVISVCRYMELFPFTEQHFYSREEEVRLIELFGEAAYFSHQVVFKGYTRGVAVAIARAFLSGEYEERLRTLCEVLSSGMPRDVVADKAGITLRNYCINMTGSTGQYIENMKFKKAQSAIRHFLDGKPMSKIYGTDQNMFPIPQHFGRVYIHPKERD